MPRDVKIQSRRGTASEWTSVNPVLALGELGVEIDTHKIKAGDGVTSWNDLPYITGPVDGDNVSLQVKRDTETNLAASTTPIPDGTLVYNQTTGRMKIGDGETLWPNLPDPGKQFKNVVTVSKDGVKGSADFRCNDPTYGGSDAACIQAAINSVSSNGAVWVMDGEYNLSEILLSTGKSFNIIGVGHVVFNCNYGVSDSKAIQISGTQLYTTTLAADASISSDIISIENIPNAQKGDLVEIYNTDLWCPIGNYPTQKTGEMYEISNIIGTTITLSQPLLRSYLSSNTTVYIFRPVRVSIQNIQFIGIGSAEFVWGVQLKYCSHSHINNCTFLDHGAGSVILSSCYFVTVTNSFITNSCRPSYGYGIVIHNSSAIINITDNRIENCRHCISSGVSSVGNHGLNRAITISRNSLTSAIIDGGACAIDSHEMTIDYTITDNKIYLKLNAAGDGQYAFLDGTVRAIFSNNYICGGGAVIRRGTMGNRITTITNNTVENTNGASLFKYYTGGTNNSIIINNNHVKDCNTTNANLDYGNIILMAGEAYKHLEICNNIFDNCTRHAISVNQAASSNTSQFLICGNEISNTGLNGIYIAQSDDTNVVDVHIQNNIITDIASRAIHVVGVKNALINNNTIRNTFIGISEGSLSDYNQIMNNSIFNCTSYIITILGANTKIFSNPGYKTENTGTAVIAASETSIVVSHGLKATPTRYTVTPSANIGNCWIDTITSTQMTIHCSTAPEANTTVLWSAIV